MEQNLLKHFRINCTRLLSQAISAQKALRSPYIPIRIGHPNHRDSKSSSQSGDIKHSEPNSSFYPFATFSSTMLASSGEFSPGEIPDQDYILDEYNLTQFSEPMAHQQEHIIQSHSESARNALIYIAVILGIYLIAVAFIAVQYYRKHSVLDPLTAYILRRSTRRSKDIRSSHRKRRRYSNSSGNGFETIRSVVTNSSSMGLRNGSSSGMNGDGQSASCSGVRFDQHATVYSENGTTTTAIESKCDQVNIQINIEQIDDDIEEETAEEEYYDEDEEEEEEEDDEFEEEEMAVLAGSDNNRPNKKQRLKNLFHFHSHSTESKSAYEPSGRQGDNQQLANNACKALTRSSSLQAADVACPMPHQDESAWRANEVDLLKFKRSSIAGFTVAASTGPLGLFKAQPKHYEETHL